MERNRQFMERPTLIKPTGFWQGSREFSKDRIYFSTYGGETIGNLYIKTLTLNFIPYTSI